MVSPSLFPFDRTPARTITIVTKGWLRCCTELTDFASPSAIIGFPVLRFGRDNVPNYGTIPKGVSGSAHF
jgi:hypothetical protein